ncbi:DUF2844 domain-containing protein [Aquirhabdus parva]|uniref:DUF2844 domain-containing protein n=2 Tax=Aquirhabdus parva TaxID=2283318 RepID=A0A345P2K4_9GAMM|nr:DUF2844 domain-containing protein [Aquirhabdus parva]
MRVVLLSMITLPVLAWAGLGGPVDPLQQNTLNPLIVTQRATSIAKSYSVHDLQDNIGGQIKEYTNAQGVVFAVTWRGPFKPDLRQLLGDYFSDYVAANDTTQTSSTPAKVVVVSEGRLRNFHGKAYVPALLPSDIALRDIQ